LFAMILRVYSYLYHLVLCLFLLGLALVALLSANTLLMPMLPWSGAGLTQWLLWGSLTGLISLALAITGVFRFLFPLWTLTVLILMVQGYLIKPYTFEGAPDFYSALILIAGALIAFLASLTLFRSRRPRRA
jgi:hypothetical protein